MIRTNDNLFYTVAGYDVGRIAIITTRPFCTHASIKIKRGYLGNNETTMDLGGRTIGWRRQSVQFVEDV